MYYNEGFLRRVWADYLAETGLAETHVDPNAFIRWAFARLIDWRAPRYDAIAKNWGVTVSARDIEKVKTPDEFLSLVDAAVRAKR
jgi:hypothetical protein